MSSDFIDGEEEGIDPFDPKDLEEAMSKFEKEENGDEERAREFLQSRRIAYSRVFSPGPTDQADIDIVLNDLARFCRAFGGALFNPNDGPHADTLAKMKDGRREVYMRILDHTRLDLNALFNKYTSVNYK